MTFTLAATAAALLLGTALFRDHAAFFLDRLFLGAAHYPTRTTIDRIIINGSVVDQRDSASPAPRVPFGKPARFEIESTGVRPEAGAVRVIAQTGGPAASLP